MNPCLSLCLEGEWAVSDSPQFSQRENIQIRNCMNIRPEGDELIHAVRQPASQTDRHAGANSRFSQFCERAEKLVRLITRQTHIKLPESILDSFQYGQRNVPPNVM